MTKGRLIAVEGRIQTRNYENNEGRRVYVTEVIASNVQFLESKNSTMNNTTNSMPEQQEKTPYDFADNKMTEPSSNDSLQIDNDPFEAFGEEIGISDNDLPF